jgi:hypothetical protein
LILEHGPRNADMSRPETDERDEYDPFWITGKALDRHFSMERALMEFT